MAGCQTVGHGLFEGLVKREMDILDGAGREAAIKLLAVDTAREIVERLYELDPSRLQSTYLPNPCSDTHGSFFIKRGLNRRIAGNTSGSEKWSCR